MNEDDILGLEAMLQAAGGVVNLTIEEREQANQAGAEVLQKALTDATKDKHYRDRKTGKVQHLADSIEVGTLEGTIIDGSKAVGYSTKDANHARIARFLNDGTKFIQGDSYIDQTINQNADTAQNKQIEELSKILDKKGGM